MGLTERGDRIAAGKIGMERSVVIRCPRMRASEARRGPCGHAPCS